MKDTVYMTISNSSGEKMLTPQEPMALNKAVTCNDKTLIIDPKVTHQPMLGMGGTWTDTDVYNLLRMNKKQQDDVLEALFHPTKGAGWNFMRLPFGSTDWESTCDYYTYDDMPRGQMDWELTHFSVQRDIDRGFFDLIRRTMKINPDLLFMASVWGVPGWMKENQSIMFGRFDPACTNVYAKYLRMCVEAFKDQGIPLYAITPQNESLTSDDRATPACRFTWRMQKDVIIALRKEFLEHDINTKIWVYDHNFDMARAFVEPMLKDPEAHGALDGVAFHDYGGSPKEMGRLQKMYPDIPFYMTERYISAVDHMDNYIQQLRNGARSYVQWTTISDEYRGPHQLVGNPFVYRKPTSQDYQTFIYNLKEEPNSWYKAASYGLYGQFTKFIKRDMVRVDCTGGHKEWVTAVAFKGDDEKIVVVVVNQTDKSQTFTLRVGDGETHINQEAKSVASYEVLPGCLCLSDSIAVDDCPQTVLTPPDCFDLEPVEILLSGELKEGKEIELSCKVRNVGNLPTPKNATLRVQFSLDGDCFIAKSTTCIQPIFPGNDVLVHCNVPFGKKLTWTAEAGYHLIFASVDIGNCYPELNIDNNKLGIEVFIES